ncbi:hypothetical protein HK405_012538, partial [Cladochytrium tenue]
MAPSTPTLPPRPELDLAEIPLVESVQQPSRLFRQFASAIYQHASSTAAAAASASADSPASTARSPALLLDIITSLPPALARAPSLADLRALHAELNALRAAAGAREAAIAANRDRVLEWSARRSDLTLASSQAATIAAAAAPDASALTRQTARPDSAASLHRHASASTI